jgi:molecular chaperone GrpE
VADHDPMQPNADAKPEPAEAAAENGAVPTSSPAGEAAPVAQTPEEEVFSLREELAAAREAVLRAQADAQNVMRRAEQDVEKARKFALERFCGELLPVVDNLERTLEAAASDHEIVKPLAEGVQLTLRSFHDTLRKFHLEVVDPVGEPFDPKLHQAMTMVENGAVEPNTVVGVMQKGYTLHGRLVRPAMVMVSKSPG